VCGDGGIRRRAGGGGGGYRDSEEGGGGLARPKLELNIKVYFIFYGIALFRVRSIYAQKVLCRYGTLYIF
jgi:hypothetical protein